jgi:hypothetical protein
MDAPGEPPTRIRFHGSTLALLAASILLTLGALWVGVSDNPPGIILLYGAGLTFLLAATHRWRDPRKFWKLFLGCVVGFVLFVAIHNFSEVGAERIAHLTLLAWMLSAISVIFFILAVILCPVGAVLGAVGGVVTSAMRTTEGS